jgi:hypothetical protein
MDEVQQIVEDFNDLLVPEALEYYLGMNEDFDMLGMDEGEESGNTDDDEDGEDGDKKDKKKKTKKDGEDEEEAGPEGEQKQECKQQ